MCVVQRVTEYMCVFQRVTEDMCVLQRVTEEMCAKRLQGAAREEHLADQVLRPFSHTVAVCAGIGWHDQESNPPSRLELVSFTSRACRALSLVRVTISWLPKAV